MKNGCCLEHGNDLNKALATSRAMQYLELSVYPGYMGEYMSDFPNVEQKIACL